MSTRSGETHRSRDPSAAPAPQAHTRWGLHLLGGRPGGLVALPVRAHLLVLVHDAWRIAVGSENGPIN